ncbi:MAG: RidA family protein [Cognatishimia sp.]
MKEIVNLPDLNAALAELNTPTSLLVRSKDMLYSCGIPPVDIVKQEIIQGDLRTQTTAVMKLMKAALEGAGSNLDKVVKTTIYVTDTAHFAPVNEVYKEFFPKNFPARSFVAVAPWPLPFDVEIDCVAEV